MQINHVFHNLSKLSIFIMRYNLYVWFLVINFRNILTKIHLNNISNKKFRSFIYIFLLIKFILKLEIKNLIIQIVQSKIKELINFVLFFRKLLSISHLNASTIRKSLNRSQGKPLLSINLAKNSSTVCYSSRLDSSIGTPCYQVISWSFLPSSNIILVLFNLNSSILCFRTV